jgi:predicted alpha/beta-hydrolase family hydrolase
MILAHVAGVPVEETLQPVLIAALFSAAWLTARLRRPRDRVRRRSESANDRRRYASRAR